MHSATFHFSVVHKYIIFRLEVMSRLKMSRIEKYSDWKSPNLKIGNGNLKIRTVQIRNVRITQLLKRLTRVHNML